MVGLMILKMPYEGDERSRTHPGHGYPAYTETVDTVTHYVTEDATAWEEEVKALHFKKEKFVFFEVQKLEELIVTTSIARK